MRKKIFNVLKFWVGFSIVLTIVCIPFQPLKRLGNQYIDVVNKTQNLGCEREKSMDVLFLGDSIPWAGISPLRMYAQDKITVYNCSTSGQRLIDSTAILKRALKVQSPSVVVVDVNCAFTYMNSMRYLLETTFPIFKYHDYYMKDFKNGKEQAGHLDDWKGYMYTDNITEVQPGDYMVQTNDDWSKTNKSFLNKIYSICQKHSISLVLMALPCPNSWNQTKHDLIQKWADRKDVEFLDLNTNGMVDIDYGKDFRDNGEHLNDSGATKCSYAISNHLKDTYNIKSRTNEVYENAIQSVGMYGQDGLQ